MIRRVTIRIDSNNDERPSSLVEDVVYWLGQSPYLRGRVRSVQTGDTTTIDLAGYRRPGLQAWDALDR